MINSTLSNASIVVRDISNITSNVSQNVTESLGPMGDFLSNSSPILSYFLIAVIGIVIFTLIIELIIKPLTDFFKVSKCSVCGLKDKTGSYHAGEFYCNSCYKKGKCSCEECGKSLTFSESRNYGSGILCKECYSLLARKFQEISFKFSKLEPTTFKKNKYQQYCGVEIECLNNNIDRNCFVYDELKKYAFNQGTDGSLSGDGAEFRSMPSNGDTLINQIQTFGEQLNKKKYFVDSSCGLHIHLETPQELDLLKKLYIFYSKYEKFFFKMLPSSRQHCDYCEKFRNIDSYDIKKIKQAKTLEEFKQIYYETNYYISQEKEHSNDKRYCWINFHSLFYRGTLEVRAHSGTINPTKINNWLLIHLMVQDYLNKNSVTKIDEMPIDEKAFLKVFSKPIRDYINDRWSQIRSSEDKFIVRSKK